jgi:uncharacterized protein (TIGR02453 family)
MKKAQPTFSKATFQFLIKASRQKNPNWLKNHQEEYEEVLGAPLKNLAENLKAELQALAPSYHFPLKGIGRLKRPINRVEKGDGLYKDWITYTAARPRESRFEHNPNLFFLIQPTDKEDPVLVAGGLYMPSSRQLRALREAIAVDATPFDQLFKTPEFKRCFREGFSKEKSSTRPPRGFDPMHPRMDWLKLQAFFVWKPYSLREFSSKNFPALVAQDWKQMIRLNTLLEKAIQGNWAKSPTLIQSKTKSKGSILDRLEELESSRPALDF